MAEISLTSNMDTTQKIEAISRKIDELSIQYTHFHNEINALKNELRLLKESLEIKIIDNASPIVALPSIQKKEEIVHEKIAAITPPTLPKAPTPSLPKLPSNLEKFIGENLSNKIGIIITVLGISIGVKYAIEHDLISPLARIIMGYLTGFVLLGVSVRLRNKYEDLSAVILSGALATLYFVTYVAYSFYQLIPQTIAFGIMVVITIFTVIAALNYNRQVIGIGGLIGAYAIPFLLSNNEGRPAILFGYMLLTNCGILHISFKKDWKLTSYISFGLTWLIFVVWFNDYYESKYFTLTAIFSSLFFVLFYIVSLAYKFIRNQIYDMPSVFILLTNSMLFYGIGYQILEQHETGTRLLGLFTLFNALIHFGVSAIVFRRNLTDKNLFFIISGLALTFVTLAIPVQLKGHWITIFWACEMLILFWIGRTKQVVAYEKISYPVMILAIISLLFDWTKGYGGYEIGVPASRLMPILNIYFLTTVIVIVSFLFIRKINKDSQFTTAINQVSFNNLLTGLIISVVYLLFFNEIATYFNQNYEDSHLTVSKNLTTIKNLVLLDLKNIWLINYSLFFAIILNVINLKKYQNIKYAKVASLLAFVSLTIFLSYGLYELSKIKNTYFNQANNHFILPMFNLAIRYVSFSLVIGILYVLNENRKRFFSETIKFNIGLELIIHASILWIISSEMIHWLELYKFDGTYKLALSILFGIYALLLIVLGINQKKKHLRLAAIGLFGFTLVKLFLYDLANLGTISKTIVMVSLGVLLLIISFLYNKYKQNLLDDESKD